MIILDQIAWGPIDADEPDDLFMEKFVSPDSIRQVLSERYPIVSGEKGSGKSAIKKYLFRSAAKLGYCAVVDISFDRLEFNTIVNEVVALSKLTDISQLTLMTNYWGYCLILEAMKAVRRISPPELPRNVHSDELNAYVDARPSTGIGILESMLTSISVCWSYIEDFTNPQRRRGLPPLLPRNLSPEVIAAVAQYPVSDTAFLQAKDCLESLLASQNGKVLIILDGFDRLQNGAATREYVHIIFESLTEAV